MTDKEFDAYYNRLVVAKNKIVSSKRLSKKFLHEIRVKMGLINHN